MPSDETLKADLEKAQNRVKKNNEKKKRNDPLPTMADIKKPYGSSYRNMMKEIKDTQENYETMFPALKGKKLEMAGFVWFQGWNDMYGGQEFLEVPTFRPGQRLTFEPMTIKERQIAYGLVFAPDWSISNIRIAGRTAKAVGQTLMPGAKANPLVRRFGTTKVVAGGLLLLAATLSSVLLWELNTAYWVIGITVAVVGFGAGAVMAPATEAIMGAVPRGKVAVGSAVNDVTRTVSAALGVAVIGSTMYSLYSSRVADALVGLPAEAATAAKDSLGAALQIAASLPGEAGAALSAAARQAFTDGFGVAMLVGAVSSLVGAVLVAKFMPARQEPLPEIRSEQGESTKT